MYSNYDYKLFNMWDRFFKDLIPNQNKRLGVAADLTLTGMKPPED